MERKRGDARFHLLRRGLDHTDEYLEVRRKILEFAPDLVVVIDVFSKKDHFQTEIIDGLRRDASFNYLFFMDKTVYNTPDNAEIVRTPEDFAQRLKEFKKVFVIAPTSLHHFLRIKAMVSGVKHPALNQFGELYSDASWVLLTHNSCGNFNSMLEKAIGYAMPYPDALGDGADLVHELEAVERGIDYIVSPGYGREYVENSHRLFGNKSRCAPQSRNARIIEVSALGYGCIHSGTLVTRIKNEYPLAKTVIIHNDRGKVAKKTGKTQISIAIFEPNSNLKLAIKTRIKKELVIASPLFFHITYDEYNNLNLPLYL